MAAIPLPALDAAVLPPESWDGWLLTTLGRTLDVAALQAMQVVVDRFMIPRQTDLFALRASAEGFTDDKVQAAPQQYFCFGDRAAHSEPASSVLRRQLRGGAVVAREISTTYTAYRGAGGVPQSLRIPFEHWTHTQRPRATVIALHGFSMGWPRIDGFALFASDFFRHGFDVALLTLPYHGPRTPREARFSGEHFAIPDVGRLNEAVRQAVYEIDLVSAWLRQHTGTEVGLLGLSLGGYLTALVAALSDTVAFAVPMVPPVCFGDLAWRFFTRRQRQAQDAAFSLEELRLAFRVHSPLTYPPRVSRERLLILAGRGDAIVPPEHPYALWRHWGEPRIHWFSGSHLAPFRRATLFKTILDHLDTIGL